MSTRRRSLGALSRAFVDHLNRILSGTVTQVPLTFEIESNQANSRFRDRSDSCSTPRRTRFGPMELYIGQIGVLDISTDGEHFFRTNQYRYALMPERHSEPQFRWEYVRFPRKHETFSRHHLQGPIPLNLFDEQNRQVTINDLHLPTGWVPVEEVLRFCVVDLGVRPLSWDWNEVLRESCSLSRAEFATDG